MGYKKTAFERRQERKIDELGKKIEAYSVADATERAKVIRNLLIVHNVVVEGQVGMVLALILCALQAIVFTIILPGSWMTIIRLVLGSYISASLTLGETMIFALFAFSKEERLRYEMTQIIKKYRWLEWYDVPKIEYPEPVDEEEWVQAFLDEKESLK